MAVDVQKGSKKDPDNPPRIECEILGHGSGHRTWSIDYLRFEGGIDDPYSGVWEKLYSWSLENQMKYTRMDDKYGKGHEFPIMLAFIDSGDQNDIDEQGEHLDTVFRFAEHWGTGCFAIKGFSGRAMKTRKNEKGDTVTKDNFRRYRAAKSGDYIYYQISTNYYKLLLYNKLKIQRRDGEWQQPGFCDFPIEYDEKYFKMLASEEKRSDNSFHSHGRRNEALDVRIYNLCAGDVYLDNLVSDLKLHWKNKGAMADQLAMINSEYALLQLANETGQELIPQKPPVIF